MKTLEARPLMPADFPNQDDDSYGTKKLLRYFEEYAKRSSEEYEKQRKATKEIRRQLLAKAQAKMEMGEIYRQVDKRLKAGEWDRCRGLPANNNGLHFIIN